MKDEQVSSNDFAVAHALNGFIDGIMAFMSVADNVGLARINDIADLNRVYVLLVHELESIYSRNPELQTLKPEPLWKHFDVLKYATEDIRDYIDNSYDLFSAHTLSIEKLCIISGVDKPDFTPDQQKLIESTKATTDDYAKKLTKIANKSIAEDKNNWQIPEYNLTYKPDGTILINGILKLKKAHAGSSIERLLEQAQKQPGTLFKPDIGQTSRNLSTILSSAGITKELRQLFFPTVSSSKGIVFRPTITRQQADNEGINTSTLDTRLKELGVKTEPKNSN